MNVKALAFNLEMEEEEFLDLLKLFFESSVSDLNVLQTALQKRETLKIAGAAHSIKGAATNLGLTEIFELTKNMEWAARENHLHPIQEWTRALQKKLDQIAETLDLSRQKAGSRRASSVKDFKTP